ncbi:MULTISPECIES: DUF4229 domain-containing protein [unclassified Arthrobacter]|uniref:DUF4229 domain-containing protein n=1 Tax=unclassified Arthrobacter TaxID=235627 RepID=UPI0002E8E787|nr:MULTISPECIES: DUF4229 domain-containing protein [unclassified Arthrobacter]PVE17388.1 DUF4229 domain-containing protein [Arthrobacter sp. Bz4]
MPFFKFTALRLGLVVVFFVISYWLGLGAIFSAVVAAILAWCVTYLFFREMRDAASASLQRRFRDGAPPQRNLSELDDAAAEDAYDPNATINADRKPRP